MKTSTCRISTRATLEIKSLQWAAVAVAVERSACFLIDGVMKLSAASSAGDFVRLRYDRKVRLGKLPDKGPVCLRSIEESVFLNLLTIQVKCFHDLMDGLPEDPAHFLECKTLLEDYVTRHGDRIRIPSNVMVNHGIDFIARNWRSIKSIADAVLSSPGHRLTAADLLARMTELADGQEKGLLLHDLHQGSTSALLNMAV